MQLGKISKHISGREAIESYTAKRRGIENIPSEYELTNMAAVAELMKVLFFIIRSILTNGKACLPDHLIKRYPRPTPKTANNQPLSSIRRVLPK